MATTYAVVGLIGRLIFNRQFGVVNYLLSLFGIAPLDWLADPTLAFVSVMIMDIWQWTPFCALILLAGLSMVPKEAEEAARLETPKWSKITAGTCSGRISLPGLDGHPDPAFGRHAQDVRRGIHHDAWRPGHGD